MSWFVKLKRTGFETVVRVAETETQAGRWAARLNDVYQTDEYYVEAYDPEKAWKP